MTVEPQVRWLLAHPFAVDATGADLDDLPTGIDKHEPEQTHDPAHHAQPAANLRARCQSTLRQMPTYIESAARQHSHATKMSPQPTSRVPSCLHQQSGR